MKKTIFVFLAILLLSLTSGAQNCNVPVRIYLSEDFSGVPVSCLNYLDKSLERIATQNGVVTDLVSTPFVVTVHVDVLALFVPNNILNCHIPDRNHLSNCHIPDKIEIQTAILSF